MQAKPKPTAKKAKAEQVIAKKNELIQEQYMKIDELQIIIKALEEELAKR